MQLADGSTIALKPHNLEEIRGGGDEGGGGFPGMPGGMPNMANMPDLANMFRQFQAGGIPGMPKMPKMPGGLSPLHALAGCALGYYFFSRYLNMKLIIFCGAATYWVYSTGGEAYTAAGGGLAGAKAAGQGCVRQIADHASKAAGRPIPDAAAMGILVVGVFLLYKFVLAGPAAGNFSGPAGLGTDYGQELYNQGFDDAEAKRPRRPPPAGSMSNMGAPAPAAKSSFGMGSMFNLFMIGSQIYQLGGGPNWSLGAAIANAKNMQPMQMMMMAMILSQFIF